MFYSTERPWASRPGVCVLLSPSERVALSSPLFSTVYLAVPYTHSAQDVRDARFEAVTDYAAELWQSGKGVYSPITQTHEAGKRHQLPQEWAFWEAQCRTFMPVCSRLVVLALPGWRESVGVRAELRLAAQMGLPTLVRTPNRFVRCRCCPENILQTTPMPCGGGECPY